MQSMQSSVGSGSVPLLLLSVWLLSLTSATEAAIEFHEIQPTNWNGSFIRDVALPKQARWESPQAQLLACSLAAAALAKTFKNVWSENCLVFVAGGANAEAKCFVGGFVKPLYCRRLQPVQQPSSSEKILSTLQFTCWTTIQHRVSDSVSFYRGWNDYVSGFGEGPNGNFWIGLESINQMTGLAARPLRMEFKKWDNTVYVASYDGFRVDGVDKKFELLSLGPFHGSPPNLQDAFARNLGMNFSALDMDNDIHETANCSGIYKGGWWYEKCHSTNPNGIYYNWPTAGNTPTDATGINWVSTSDSQLTYYYSLKEFEMLLLIT